MLCCYWLQLPVLYDDMHTSNVPCDTLCVYTYTYVCVPLLSSVQPQSGVCTDSFPLAPLYHGLVGLVAGTCHTTLAMLCKAVRTMRSDTIQEFIEVLNHC